MNLFTYLVIVGVVAGSVGTIQRMGRRTLVYIGIAVIGALGGAFLAFGDAPILMKYPILNERTTSVLGAVVVVAIARAIEHKYLAGKTRN